MAKQSIIFIVCLFFNLLCICTTDEVTDISCALGTNCVLPCAFSSGSYTSIHWRKDFSEARVHSFYSGQNQLQNQHQDFRYRTSLFQGEIHRGNASLLLSKVSVQDEGRYVCFTSTTSDSSVSTTFLTVFVNIGEVDLVRQGSELVCSSKGIYPEPKVKWWISDGAKTSVHQREDQLYDITSSTTLQSVLPVPWISCNVSTSHSSRRAVIIQAYYLVVSNNDAVLRCFHPKDRRNPVKSLIWKFNQNQTILTWFTSQHFYSPNESWTQFVDAVTKSNRLVLTDLTSDQEGDYSCHISTDTETFISIIKLHIQLEIKLKQIYESACVFILIMILLWCLCGYFKSRQNNCENMTLEDIRSICSLSMPRESLVNSSTNLQNTQVKITPKRLSGHRGTEKKKH